MTKLVAQTMDMVSMLPEDRVMIIQNTIKEQIRSWDPDYTRLTPSEKRSLDNATVEMNNGIYFTEEEIWGDDGFFSSEENEKKLRERIAEIESGKE